MEALQGEITCF